MHKRHCLVVLAIALAGVSSGCQTSADRQIGPATAATQAELEAEARAFGAAQAASVVPTMFDPTGLASLGVMAVNGVTHKAWLASAQARSRAAQEADLQAMYKKYGMNPDGTPSGKPGPGSGP